MQTPLKADFLKVFQLFFLLVGSCPTHIKSGKKEEGVKKDMSVLKVKV